MTNLYEQTRRVEVPLAPLKELGLVDEEDPANAAEVRWWELGSDRFGLAIDLLEDGRRRDKIERTVEASVIRRIDELKNRRDDDMKRFPKVVMNRQHAQRFVDQNKYVGLDDRSDDEHEIKLFDIELGVEGVFRRRDASCPFEKEDEHELSTQKVKQRKRFCKGGTGFKKSGRKLQKPRGLMKDIPELPEERGSNVAEKIVEGENIDVEAAVDSRDPSDPEVCERRVRRFAQQGSLSRFSLSESIDVLSDRYGVDTLSDLAERMGRAERDGAEDRARRIASQAVKVVDEVRRERAGSLVTTLPEFVRSIGEQAGLDEDRYLFEKESATIEDDGWLLSFAENVAEGIDDEDVTAESVLFTMLEIGVEEGRESFVDKLSDVDGYGLGESTAADRTGSTVNEQADEIVSMYDEVKRDEPGLSSEEVVKKVADELGTTERTVRRTLENEGVDLDEDVDEDRLDESVASDRFGSGGDEDETDLGRGRSIGEGIGPGSGADPSGMSPSSGSTSSRTASTRPKPSDVGGSKDTPAREDVEEGYEPQQDSQPSQDGGGDRSVGERLADRFDVDEETAREALDEAESIAEGSDRSTEEVAEELLV